MTRQLQRRNLLSRRDDLGAIHVNASGASTPNRGASMEMNDADNADHVSNDSKEHPIGEVHQNHSSNVSMNDRKRSRPLDRCVQSLDKRGCESTTQAGSFPLVPVIRFSKIATGRQRETDASLERQLKFSPQQPRTQCCEILSWLRIRLIFRQATIKLCFLFV